MNVVYNNEVMTLTLNEVFIILLGPFFCKTFKSGENGSTRTYSFIKKREKILSFAINVKAFLRVCFFVQVLMRLKKFDSICSNN